MSPAPPPPDPSFTDPAIQGVVGAGALWGIERIRQLVAQHKAKKLSFVEDPQHVEAVRKARKNMEFLKYKKYLRDEDRRVIVMLGLRLRELAEQPTDETEEQAERRKAAVDALKARIRRQYDAPGVHLAQAAQAEMLSIIIDKHTKARLDEKTASERIIHMVENIDEYVRFVEEWDTPEKLSDDIVRHIKWQQPNLYMIAASGYARTEARATANKVRRAIVGMGYISDVYPTKIREVHVFTARAFA